MNIELFSTKFLEEINKYIDFTEANKIVVQYVLAGLLKAELEPELKPPTLETMEETAKEICAKHRITVKELKSHERHQEFIKARQEFCQQIRCTTELTLGQIAEYLGGRDHSTIIHLINRKTRKTTYTKRNVTA